MKLQPVIDNLQSKLGIAVPNPMQQVMASTDSRNILLLAPTGSGKTVAFGLYLFRRLRPDSGLQAVVMAPSRELVLQIHEVLRSMACDGVKITSLYGGHPVADEVKSLSVMPHVVVATPGRLLDHIQRGNLRVDNVGLLVIDEYDKLLELGFSDEMTRIVGRMKHVHNIALTSATRLERMPGFMPQADIDTLDYTSAAAQSPRHRMQVVQVSSPVRDKLGVLVELMKSLPNRRTIVFVNHRESAGRVYDALVGEGFPAGLYHGGLEQRERQLALDMFDNGTTPVLVATDLAARGLDIDDIGSVIHYHMPADIEAWTHRNGRTARQDATGTIYVITHEDENLPEYITFDRSTVPSGHASEPLHSVVTTLYINAGRREKISRGDIVGYLINRGGLEASDIGKIKVGDHASVVAVSRDKAQDVVKAVAPHRLKNTRVRVSKVDINHKKC